MKKIVLRLKELRGDESQTKFAAKLGLPQQTYYRYESGKSEPPLSLLKDVSLKFGVSANWLLGLPERGKSGDGAADALKVAALKGAIQAILDKF